MEPPFTSEAFDLFLAEFEASVGATSTRFFGFPTQSSNGVFTLVAEGAGEDGAASLHFVRIDVDGISREASYVNAPVELTDRAVPGALEDLTLINSSAVQGDWGYDVRAFFRFDTLDGPERVAVYSDLASVGSRFRDISQESLFEERASLLVGRHQDDPQTSPQDDAVEVAPDGETRSFKGDDVLILTGAGTAYGGSGEDIIQARSGDDRLFGNQNDDIIYSGSGFDFVDGGTGDDLIVLSGEGEGRGGKGNDRLYADKAADLYGGQGQDTLYGGKEGSVLSGGDGADFIRSGIQPRPFAGGSLERDTIYGGKSNDSIIGGAGADEIYGGRGKDVIEGGSGGDMIKGGADADVIHGESSGDVIYGGDGNDLLYGGSGNDSIYGGNGNDIIDVGNNLQDFFGGFANGGSGDDDILGSNTRDELRGGIGDDRLVGLRGNDTLDGGAGDDRLFGGDDADTLNGGDGADFVYGGRGDDFIRGGHDDDTLIGGQGADVFGFGEDGSTDVVTDFEVGTDRIELVNFSGDLEFDDLFLSQDDSAAVIEAGDVVIRLENTDAEDLDEASFLL